MNVYTVYSHYIFAVNELILCFTFTLAKFNLSFWFPILVAEGPYYFVTQCKSKESGFRFWLPWKMVVFREKGTLKSTMGSSEKFCLRWNDFEVNISNAFHDLKEERDFADVTLACGDKQVEVHKVILAASSPFFKKILKNNPHSHPLIYLKGTKFSDVEAVLNYIYHGEVNIDEANLNAFLEVAEDLEVKGLVPGKNYEGGSCMQSPFPRTATQSSASRNTKQQIFNVQSTVQKYGQLSSQTLQESSPSVNNNASEVVPVKVESEDTFAAPAFEEKKQETDLENLNHQQVQCSEICLII